MIAKAAVQRRQTYELPDSLELFTLGSQGVKEIRITEMIDREYTFSILKCLYEVHKELGPGLLESIYEEAIVKELTMAGFHVKRQVNVPVIYKGEAIKNDLRLDIIVDNRVILEIKSVTDYKKLFEKQLFTYLRLTGCSIGYVVNFNVESLRDGIHTVFNRYAEESTE